MSSKLPLNLDDLLRQRTVERDRIEYKAGWNPDAIVRTLCAFANDMENAEKIVARRYRNRRIGEFLKELDLTEGRCTGIPTIRTAMAENGSPPPRFSTDEGRTYFLAELPVHPEMPGAEGTHEEVHEEVLNETEQRLLIALEGGPKSRAEMAESLGMKSRRSGHLSRAMERLRRLRLAELTIPDKPQSRNQKMRITERGRGWLARERDGLPRQEE
jgi:ATP-dependent DNA helicase RecG